MTPGRRPGPFDSRGFASVVNVGAPVAISLAPALDLLRNRVAAGVAVVADDLSGLRDAVNGRGTLVRSGDRRAMADACGALVGTPTDRGEIAALGCAAVRGAHGWEAEGSRPQRRRCQKMPAQSIA